MKSKYFSFLIICIYYFFATHIKAQESKIEFEPTYITVHTLHGIEGSDMEQWKAVEEEYFNKVINNIDLLISHQVLISYFDSGLSEVKIINVFKNWNDIHKFYRVRDQLILKAWPKEGERDAFFEKQNSFYSNYHSDEIYTSTEFGKYLSTELKENKDDAFVFFEKTSLLSDDENDESYQYYKKYIEEVIFKNPLIRAYRPYRHSWGPDSREFIEMLVVDSLIDLEQVLKINKDLLEELVPDEANRNQFNQHLEKAIIDKNVTVYKNVPSLSK